MRNCAGVLTLISPKTLTTGLLCLRKRIPTQARGVRPAAVGLVAAVVEARGRGGEEGAGLAQNVVEQAAQPARRTASMVVLIAQRLRPALRTLAAAIQPMPPLLLYGCLPAHHVSGLAAWYASPCPSGRRSNGPAPRGGQWAPWRPFKRCAARSRTREYAQSLPKLLLHSAR